MDNALAYWAESMLSPCFAHLREPFIMAGFNDLLSPHPALGSSMTRQPDEKGILDDAWRQVVGGMEWLKPVFLGEFSDNRPLSAVIADMLVSFLPGVVVVTSARDAVAVVLRLANHPEKREDLMEWVLLCACLIVIALPLAMAAGGVRGGRRWRHCRRHRRLGVGRGAACGHAAVDQGGVKAGGTGALPAKVHQGWHLKIFAGGKIRAVREGPASRSKQDQR